MRTLRELALRQALLRDVFGVPPDLTCPPPRRPRGWHPGRVGLLIRLVELLIVLLPLTGLIVAAVKALTGNRRRAEESPDADRALPTADTAGCFGFGLPDFLDAFEH